MDVGSRWVCAPRVAREPDVTRGTRVCRNTVKPGVHDATPPALEPGDRPLSCAPGTVRCHARPGPSVVRRARDRPLSGAHPGPSVVRRQSGTVRSHARAIGSARTVGVSAGPAASGQRIDGVSRSLPYSDLLALTSSGRLRGGRVRPRLMEAIAHFANRVCRCSCRVRYRNGLGPLSGLRGALTGDHEQI
jgi:hypothetical protein